MTTRFRIRGGMPAGGTWNSFSGSTPTGSVTASYSVGYVAEKLTSERHYFPPSRARLSRWERRHQLYYGKRDLGGPFSVQRRAVQVAPAVIPYATTSFSGIGSWWEFRGSMIPFETPIGVPSMSSVPSLINNSTMIGKGVVGWNKWKPTHTQVSIGQTLGELRTLGGLPISAKMIQEIRDIGVTLINPLKSIRRHLGNHNPGFIPKAVGSGYLGYQFGIKPYIKDLTDLTKSLLEFDKNLRQLVRDNGRAVRRKGKVSFNETVSDSRITASTPGSILKPALPTQLYTGTYTSDRHTVTSLEFWFSGRFRYHLDPTRHGWGPIPDRERYQLQRILYGVDPTDVTLIWQLMPWSWLIDWIVPIGPMIDNLVNDHTDRLVADYAYIMGRAITSNTYVVRGALRNTQPFTTTCVIIDETKQRAVATPYGFGLSFTGFSLKQLAILAALGVTRG